MEPTVLTVDLPAALRPGVYWPSERAVYILVQDGLHPDARRSVIAHELAHHARGGGIDHPGMPPDWQAVVARDEAATDRHAAAELIPPSRLSAWCDEQADAGIGVGPAEVAAAWNVTRRIAEAALDHMNRWERGR